MWKINWPTLELPPINLMVLPSAEWFYRPKDLIRKRKYSMTEKTKEIDTCVVDGCECGGKFIDPDVLCEAHWAMWWFSEEDGDVVLEKIKNGHLVTLQDQEHFEVETESLNDEDANRSYDQYQLVLRYINNNTTVHYWDLMTKEECKCPTVTPRFFIDGNEDNRHKWSQEKEDVNCHHCLKIIKES